MRYTRIDIEGDAGIFASLTRKRGDEAIDIEIISPDGETSLRVNTKDRDAQWAMAERLQATLDGVRGCGGDIREYFHAIEHLAD